MKMKESKRITSKGGLNIPVSIRRAMGMECRDAMELEVTGENELVVRPYQIRCIFCGELEVEIRQKGKGICRSCLDEIMKGVENHVNDQ